MELHQLTDAELDTVNGGGWGGFVAIQSFNKQNAVTVQKAANVQAGLVNVPVASSQTIVQAANTQNSIG